MWAIRPHHMSSRLIVIPFFQYSLLSRPPYLGMPSPWICTSTLFHPGHWTPSPLAFSTPHFAFSALLLPRNHECSWTRMSQWPTVIQGHCAWCLAVSPTQKLKLMFHHLAWSHSFLPNLQWLLIPSFSRCTPGIYILSLCVCFPPASAPRPGPILAMAAPAVTLQYLSPAGIITSIPAPAYRVSNVLAVCQRSHPIWWAPFPNLISSLLG